MQIKSPSGLQQAPLDIVSVLVVEDELLIRIMVSDHLRAAGFWVIEAFNGDEAIAILKSTVRTDVVFTDVRMPGEIDGMALLDQIRRDWATIPVVMTSGHLDPALAYAGGASRFLPKPCDLDDVIAALREALGRSC